MKSIFMFPCGSYEYSIVKESIRKKFLEHYQATPCPTPDLFMCLIEEGESVPGSGCISITFGESKKLFSEYYLDYSINIIHSLSRKKIAELGSLCSFKPEMGTEILSSAINILDSWGYELIILTATSKVRNILDKLNLDVYDHGSACKTKVKDKNVNWGNYYDYDPRVIAINPKSKYSVLNNKNKLELLNSFC